MGSRFFDKGCPYVLVAQNVEYPSTSLSPSASLAYPEASEMHVKAGRVKQAWEADSVIPEAYR